MAQIDVILVEGDSPDQIDEAIQEAIEEARRIEQELMDSLANAITNKFRTRATNRRAKEGQWLRSSELYYGKLAFTGNLVSRETPFEIVNYTNRPDVNIVRTKCSIAIAQTFSMQFGTGNKNWDLWASKLTEAGDEEAKAAAMADTIEKQLNDCHYTSTCWKAMRDRVILGSAVLKGPNSAGKLVRTYVQLPGSTTWIPDVAVDYSPELCYINPWFFYPDETVDNLEDLGDTIEAHPMAPIELKKLLKHKGFIADAITDVLEHKPADYRDTNWQEFAKLSENNANLFKGKYLVLEYHGPISRTQLDQLSIEPTYDSINDEYYGEVWVCENRVIRIQLEDIEASFRPPYYMSVWEKDPASVFGFGVPLMMEDAQRVVNETWHMILDNSSMSSGSQVAMHKHLIEPANGKWELGPNQIWYLTDPSTAVSDAIQFFNVPNTTEFLIPVMQLAQNFAEEESQIPLITAGLQSPQTQDSATGQLVIQQASTTLLDFMSEEWDSCITAPIIEAWYGWNMQYSKDDSIKGPFTVDVRTSSQYKNKQVHIRNLEKLSVECASNPAMAAWVNIPELQRVRLMAMNLPDEAIIKSKEQYEADKKAAAQAAGPDISLLELQLKGRQLDLEEAQLAFNSKQQQARDILEHEEKMEATRARLIEAQGRVAVSQNDKDIAILQLSQRNKEAADKIMSSEKMQREDLQTTIFLKNLEEARKQREVSVKQAEAEAYRIQVSEQRNNNNNDTRTEDQS